MSPTEKKFNEVISAGIQTIKSNTERMRSMKIQLDDCRDRIFCINVEKFSRITQKAFLDANHCLDKI